MTTNEIMQTVQADMPIVSEELSDLELDPIAGGAGTNILYGSPAYENLKFQAEEKGPVVAFKFHMATAVALMGGKSATVTSILDPSRTLDFRTKQ